jgi:16S rRNA processing protein RimM
LTGYGSGHGTPHPEQHWVWLARIRRTQGRKGEVFAEILTDFPEKFVERRHLWLISDKELSSPVEPRAVELVNHWPHKGGIVLHFAGVDSISAAEGLIGLAVAIPRTERTELAEGEAYVGDLIGCTLIDVSGPESVVIGTVEDVDLTAGPAPLLIVRGSATAKNQNEILIPFAKAYLQRLDIEGRRIEMALPEGLIDLN